MWGKLKEFFKGLYGLFWIEVLSMMGMALISAPSLQQVISWAKVRSALYFYLKIDSSWIQNSNLSVIERIQDVCHFIIAFHTPISVSTLHIYTSTGPFLPSQSHLSSVFNNWFTKMIQMQRGKLLSWPVPPLQWIGHSDAAASLSCSPNRQHIVTGSNDKTICIWDVKTGATVGNPLKGHTGPVQSVAYSPDGQYIITGSEGMTI